jgi:hypothetical protein
MRKHDDPIRAAKALLAMAKNPETPAEVRAAIYMYIIDRALGEPRESGGLTLC